MGELARFMAESRTQKRLGEKRRGFYRRPDLEYAAVRDAWHWYLLLIIPFIGTLWVPFYNAVDPRLAGVPYFYWYQFLWIAISVGLTTIVYFATRGREP